MRTRLLIAFLIFFIRSAAQTAYDYNELGIQAFDNKNYLLCIEYCTKALSIQSNGTSYWNRGAAYYGLNKYQESRDDYTRAIPYYTDNVSLGKLYRYRAECYMGLNKYALANTDLLTAANYTIDKYDSYYWDLAAVNYNLKNYATAEEYYLKTLPYYNDIKEKGRLYKLIGECQYYTGKYKDALESVNYAINVDPGNINAYVIRMNIREVTSQYKQAAEDCQKIMDLNTDMSNSDKNDYLTRMVRYKWRLGDYVSAILNGKRALLYDTTNNLTFWNLALAYSSNNENLTAIALNDKAIALTSDKESLGILYRNKAIYYSEMLQFRNALTAVNRSLTYDNDPGTVWRKAIIYAAMKNIPAALNEYEGLVSLYTDSANLSTIYLERAQLWKAYNDFDRALYDMKKAMSLNSSTFMKYRYGKMLAEVGKDLDRAKEYLEEAAYEDKRADTCSDYSYSMVMLGRVEAAVENSFRLIDKDRFNKERYPWALYNLACIYSLAGNQAKAVDYLDRSFAAGFKDFQHLISDEDLSPIRNTTEYKLILAKYKVPLPQY